MNTKDLQQAKKSARRLVEKLERDLKDAKDDLAELEQEKPDPETAPKPDDDDGSVL